MAMTSGVGGAAKKKGFNVMGGVISAFTDNMPPLLEPVLPMPDPDDMAVRTQRRRSMAEQRRRQGRASTIMTAVNSDVLGA